MTRTRQKQLKSSSAPKISPKQQDAGCLDETPEILRQKIKDLISASKSENYATISALLGRSHSYIQQYITRGSPRFLLEADRRKIARHFGISAREFLVEDNDAEKQPDDAIIVIALWTTNNCDGATRQTGQALASSDSGLPFRQDWIHAHFPVTSNLAAIKIIGDAMAPTLINGSFALIDQSQISAQRDGLYALCAGGEVLPRRLSLNPLTGRITIATDNHLYPSQPDCAPGSLSILGRIIWTGQFI